MIEYPTFKSSFHVEAVDPEGVFLLSERGHFVLKGPLYCRLAPWLNGRHTTDEIVDALAGEASPAEVYYAVARLEDKGYVVEAASAFPADRVEFWHALGLDAPDSERRLQNTTVQLAGFGGVPLDPFASALAALEVRTSDEGDFAVALTDDYLRKDLEEFNAAALMSGRPWLLVKPVGTVIWIGPVFRAGETACWECLAQRLRANRQVLMYLHRKQGISTPFPICRGTLSATLNTALGLAALETVKAIADADRQGLNETLITLDLHTLATQRHRLVRRPQCPRCGDPAYRSDQQPVPVRLESRKKHFTADGGHRTASPEKTLERYEHHVSEITGAVTRLTASPVDEDGLLRVYGAGHNQAMEYDSLRFLRQGLRSHSGGKGITNAQAKASGLCEALERYSGCFQGHEIRRTSSYRQLGSIAIHPNACMLYSERQYQNRDEWNARGSPYVYVSAPLDDEKEVQWTPVWSLTAQEFKYLPTDYLYYGYRDIDQIQADSNGNAAGNTLEEAIIQGFMELVERDSVAIWWYNRLRRREVDLVSFEDRYIHEVIGQYRKMNREIWVLDITSDLGIPAFAAVSRRMGQSGELILFGFGAHFDPRIGLLRSLTEVNQSAAIVKGLDGVDDMDFDPVLKQWWQVATVANQPYLVPDGTTPRCRSDYDSWWSDDVREDVLRCQEIVERQGMEMLVLDQTRPDIGLPVVKVIVPGLRHFWTRFAPGRLYDVPVKMGWLEQPLTEDQLNPMAMML
jgi:bacteriocin biosynthesis cyclodehydratase domain-containing protein